MFFIFLKFIFIFYNFKNNFQNLILCGMPHGKSCTVSNCHVANILPLQHFGGVRDLFQRKKLQGYFPIFFCRDENQNWSKLPGRKSYLSLQFNYTLVFSWKGVGLYNYMPLKVVGSTPVVNLKTSLMVTYKRILLILRSAMTLVNLRDPIHL